MTMKIRRRHMPVLMAAGVVVGVGLALLLTLVVGVGVAQARVLFEEDGTYCGTRDGYSFCCTWWAGEGGYHDLHEVCSGPWVTDVVGCSSTWEFVVTCDGSPAVATAFALVAVNGNGRCQVSMFCTEPTGGSIWLADVCEPDDGFSADGWMTWDSGHDGPLQVGASMEGPWYDVEVNGPPWALNEEMLESFAAMVGVADWHNLWVRSGEGYPQHVGNAVIERDGRMDALCAE